MDNQEIQESVTMRESEEARNPETLRVPLTLSAWKNLDNPDS